MTPPLRGEALFHSFLYHRVDIVAGGGEVLGEGVIGDAEDVEAEGGEVGGAGSVVGLGGGLAMLRAVELDDEGGLHTEKIHDVVSDHTLLIDMYRVVPQEAVPQAAFFFGHAFAERTGVGDQVAVGLHRLPPFGLSLGLPFQGSWRREATERLSPHGTVQIHLLSSSFIFCIDISISCFALNM